MQFLSRLLLGIYLAFALLAQAGLDAAFVKKAFAPEVHACCMPPEDDGQLPDCCTEESGCLPPTQESTGRMAYTVVQAQFTVREQRKVQKPSVPYAQPRVSAHLLAQKHVVAWQATTHTPTLRDAYVREHQFRT
jgi:hypothetical protein